MQTVKDGASVLQTTISRQAVRSTNREEEKKKVKAVILAIVAALCLAAVSTGYLLYRTGEELEEEKSNRGRRVK